MVGTGAHQGQYFSQITAEGVEEGFSQNSSGNSRLSKESTLPPPPGCAAKGTSKSQKHFPQRPPWTRWNKLKPYCLSKPPSKGLCRHPRERELSELIPSTGLRPLSLFPTKPSLGLFFFPFKTLHPHSRKWVMISMLALGHTPRSRPSQPSTQLKPDLT